MVGRPRHGVAVATVADARGGRDDRAAARPAGRRCRPTTCPPPRPGRPDAAGAGPRPRQPAGRRARTSRPRTRCRRRPTTPSPGAGPPSPGRDAGGARARSEAATGSSRRRRGAAQPGPVRGRSPAWDDGPIERRVHRMDCAALLLEHRSSILDESYTVLERSHVHHYEAAGEEFTRGRLEGLFDLVVTAIAQPRPRRRQRVRRATSPRSASRPASTSARCRRRSTRSRRPCGATIVDVGPSRGPRRGDRPAEHRARLRQGRPGPHLRVAGLAAPRALARPHGHVRRHPGPPTSTPTEQPRP